MALTARANLSLIAARTFAGLRTSWYTSRTQAIVEMRVNDDAHGCVVLLAAAGCFGGAVGVVRRGLIQGVFQATDLGIAKQVVVPGEEVFAVDLEVVEDRSRLNLNSVVMVVGEGGEWGCVKAGGTASVTECA
ncbi:hypothetical protein BCR44DRAFT_37987 [Catenaria anguillulae PL171]|uniref:Uncharacterized protein n=1 Tax=Catenaria anguillulae PL171 TaxID=765915 RepID=A0A1Y2HTS6_9FUNG|nr:hypothetical protein BCR44DRAFT_37987 [Catenaria anguillulae PL171]